MLSTVKSAGFAARGEEWTDRQKADFEEMIRQQYDTQGSPYYASARLWDDGVIDPADTRSVLARGLAAALSRPMDEEKPFGIFRM